MGVSTIIQDEREQLFHREDFVEMSQVDFPFPVRHNKGFDVVLRDTDPGGVIKNSERDAAESTTIRHRPGRRARTAFLGCQNMVRPLKAM